MQTTTSKLNQQPAIMFMWNAKSKLFKMGYMYGKLEERSDNRCGKDDYTTEEFIDDVNNLLEQLKIKIVSKDIEGIMGIYTSSEIEDVIIKGKICKKLVDIEVCVCMRKGRIEIVDEF
jgi:hypothetical protein